MIEVKLKDKEG